MTDDPSFDPQLLDRYLAGDLSAEERRRYELQLSASPLNAEFARLLPRAALGRTVNAEADAAWHALSARIASAPATDELAPHRQRDASAITALNTGNTAGVAARSRRMWRSASVRIAAVLCIVIGGAATWRALNQPRDGIAEAPFGRDVTTTLPDGTQLTLAAGSRASWTREYGKPRREIRLEGEGLFVVLHDDARPFVVRTRDAVATDIGTRFVVRGWAELSGVEVAVEEGLVSLADSTREHTAQRTVLRAGQLGRLAAGGQVMVSTDADAALAWTRGQLVFEKTPLSTVLLALSRRFDVELRADTSLMTRQLSARFSAQSLPDVLDAIAVALSVRVVTNGRTLTLLPL